MPGRAQVIDHIGPPRHPYRVTIIRLDRVKETYELRWKENVRLETGEVVREKRTARGGHSKTEAYPRAEKVHANLHRSDGYHGTPPKPKAPAQQRRRYTLRQVAQMWLAQHPGKPGTVEGYQSLLDSVILPRLTWTEIRGGKVVTRSIELGAILVYDIQKADVNNWTKAAAVKPDGRTKNPADITPISSSSVNAALRILNACLNWAVHHDLLQANPAANVTVTVHGARQPEWFRTPEDFWAALAHIPSPLHHAFITTVYLGLRVNELAALQWQDLDLPNHRIMIRHNFDKRRRPSTVKTAESENWMPLHPEAEAAITAERTTQGTNATGSELIFRGPRGGILGSSLINDTLTDACAKAQLGYRVTAHGLRHSFANWLKQAGVHTRDIQTALRHRDPRTTNGYLHTSHHETSQAINRLPRRPDAAA